MTIRVTCPGCDRALNLANDLAGKKIRCPGCRRVVSVPDGTGERTTDRPRSRRPRDDEEIADALLVGETPWGWILGGAGVAVLLLTGVIVAVVVAMRSGSGTPAPLAQLNVPPGKDRQNPVPIPPRDQKKDIDRPRNVPVVPPVVTAWRVQPDPLPDDLKPPENPKGAIAVAGHLLPVVYPTTFSPFVSVAGKVGNVETREVWDLRTGQRVGQVNENKSFDGIALSPDGKQMACSGLGRSQQAVQVWTVAGGEHQVAVDARSGGLAVIDFAGPGQLVTAKAVGSNRVVQVWNIATGAELRQFKVPGLFTPKQVAFSQGRRYFAVAAKNPECVLIYDLTTGQLAGAIASSAGGGCLGLAFSPDGKSLAGLFQTRLVVWNLASSGDKIVDRLIDKEGPRWSGTSYQGPAIDWMADGSALVLHGQTLLDPTTGGNFWSLPMAQDNKARRVFAGTLAVYKSATSRSLTFEPLPVERLTAARTAVRAGQDPTATVLPAARSADWSQVKTLSAPAGAVPWTATADPAPAAKGPLAARPVPLRDGEPQQLLFSQPDAGLAIVLAATRIEGQVDRQQLRADRYDLTSGQHLGGLDLFVADLPVTRTVTIPADAAPDGVLVAVREPKDGRRIDLWSLAEKKHVAGWLPYEKEADPRVSWVGFADARHLLTLNAAGKLTLWDVPECRAIYTVPVGRTAPAFSPGRKYVAVATATGLDVLVAATGARAGQFADATGAALAMAYRQDGREVAALMRGPGTEQTVRRWDATTGASTAEFPTFASGTDLQWAGTDHLLVGQGQHLGPTLIDCALKWVVARYQVPGRGRHTATSPDGRHWFASSRGLNQPYALTAQTLPDAVSRQFARGIAAGQVQLVLAPGMSLAVRAEGAAPPGDSGAFHQAIVARQAGFWQAVGYKVVPQGGDLALTVRVAQRDTGQTRRYELRKIGRPMGGMKPTVVTVNVKEVAVEMALTDRTGGVLWSEKLPPVRTPNTVGVVETDDINAYLERALWASVTGGQSRPQQPPPSAIVRTPAGLEPLPRSVTLTGDR